MKKTVALALMLLACSPQRLKYRTQKTIRLQQRIAETAQLLPPKPDMIEISGQFCPTAIQSCLKYKDPPNSIVRRCTKFAPTKCTSAKIGMQFWIDREEFTEDGRIPVVSINWFEAKKTCEQRGKRLCTEQEWTFACEGEKQLPYPYGYERDSSTCNIDNEELVANGKLIDRRATIDKFPNCLSPFDVHNMTGNVDEWVFSTRGSTTSVPYVSGLKGGWWGPLRNRCRPMTDGHNQAYKQEQIGFRCCKD
jgi:sulfatase modifying factor 1